MTLLLGLHEPIWPDVVGLNLPCDLTLYNPFICALCSAQ